MKVSHLYGLSPLWVRRWVLRVDGLAYPLPQILHTFFPSEEESGEEGEEKGGVSSSSNCNTNTSETVQTTAPLSNDNTFKL